MRITRACLAVCFALVACSERDVAAPDPFAPSFDANPESSGAVVVRDQVGVFYTLWDGELLVAHVFRNPYAACVPPGTPYDAYPLDRQRVISDDAADLIRQLITADEISIKVWHSTTGNWAAVRCTPPLAEGVGKLVATDNDALADSPLNDRLRANSFGLSAHGTLTAPEGQRYSYSGTYRAVWRPSDQRALNEGVRVQLVPIGN